jgi:hypothetical protein
MFGTLFKEKRLEVINQIDPPTLTEWGNDGQMYVQIAIDPLLYRVKELSLAIDRAGYRARRMGMPIMAYILGGGTPKFVVHIFSILNLLFWFMFLLLLYKFVGINHLKDFQLAVSLLWTTGTLTSLTRSLTDFPAVVLIMISIWVDSFWVISSMIFSYSILVKETSVLSLFAFIWPLNFDRENIKKKLLRGLMIVGPPILWFLYVSKVFDGIAINGLNVFLPPFIGLSSKIKMAFDLTLMSLSTESSWPLFQVFHIFDFISPLSFLVQSFYLLLTPRINSMMWRMGIGFGLLVFFLGSAVWNDQYAFTRVLLPLTFCFNFLIHENEKKWKFEMWYILGNFGMLWGFINITYNLYEFFRVSM